MTRKITVGIDIGTFSTKVVVSEHFKDQAMPSVIGTGFAESDGLRRGYIVNFDEAVKSIKKAVAEAEKSSRVKIKRAYVSIGGISLESVISHGQAIVSRADGEVSDLDVKKAMEESEKGLGELKNKKIIHSIPVRFKLEGKEVMGRPVGLRGLKLEVKTLFITSLSQHFDDLLEAVENAGVEVTDVVASPIAASLVSLSKRQRNVGCILVNIGAETVSIVVYENDTPISLDVFPIGSTDITNDMALGLKIAPEEAERVKIGGNADAYSRKKLDEIIEARLTDIFELIESHLKKIGRNGLLPAGIILTGGGSGISTIEDLAKASLKLPVKVFGREVSDQTKGKIRDSSWFVAYGLSILSGTGTAIEENGFLRDLKRLLGKTRDVITSSTKQLLP
ncbi:MAG: cell division protein FtsA [Candidatus Paceibacterota bacterium]|jgi:cell division protein FtsA